MDINNMIKNKKQYRLCLEAGLAVLLVLTLALAGRSGLLQSKNAEGQAAHAAWQGEKDGGRVE